MPDMPEPSNVPAPKPSPWANPTLRLSTDDVTNLLGEAVPDMDATVTVVAKVVGVERGNRMDYDTNERKPRNELQLEIQSITPASGGETEKPDEMEDETEDEGVMSDSEEEKVLGYKRPKGPSAEIPFPGLD